MTTLTDRPNTALLVVDVQTGVVAGAHRRDEVVATIGSLVGRARAEGVPVVWIQHNSGEFPVDSDAWQIVPELQRTEGEPRLDKQHGDSFEDTTLASVLEELKVGRVIVTGAQTDACILSTLHGAKVRGYDTTLVTDAHTTEDLTEWGMPAPDKVITLANLHWKYASAPGRTAEAVEAKEVAFS